MKKHLLRRVLVLVVLFCILCFGSVVPAVTVNAEEEGKTGNISVQIAPFAEGAELSLYEIGSCKNGKFRLNDNFKESNVDVTNLKDSAEMKETADDLAGFAYDFGIEPADVKRVDAEGVVRFSGVDANFKLYLITQTSSKTTVAISSFIVRMPYYTQIGGSYLYNLKVQAKYIDTRDKDNLGAIVLDKICPKGYHLKGAVFSFEQRVYYTNVKTLPDGVETGEDVKGTYYWKMLSKNMTTNENGQIVIEDLPFGIYRFIELKAPTNFVLDATPHIARVDSYGTVTTDEEGYYVADEGESVILTVVNEKYCNPCDNSIPCQPSNPCDTSTSSQPSNPTSDPEVTQPDNSDPEVTHPDISYPDISNPDISYPDISYPDISYPDISYPTISNEPTISYPTISYPTISYPTISYPTINNPTISYPQITPTNNGKGNSIFTGDDINKYIVVSALVIVSFGSSIVLMLISGKKKKSKSE